MQMGEEYNLIFYKEFIGKDWKMLNKDTKTMYVAFSNDLTKLYKLSNINTAIPIELVDDEMFVKVAYQLWNIAKQDYLFSIIPIKLFDN